jgi:hypothetical protein
MALLGYACGFQPKSRTSSLSSGHCGRRAAPKCSKRRPPAPAGPGRSWRVSSTGSAADEWLGTVRLLRPARSWEAVTDAQHWEDLLRLAGSLRLGTVQAAGLIRTLQTKNRSTRWAACPRLGTSTAHSDGWANEPAKRPAICRWNERLFRFNCRKIPQILSRP